MITRVTSELGQWTAILTYVGDSGGSDDYGGGTALAIGT